MNNAMAHNNDLNGFRSGITEEHEQFQSGMAARQNSYLQNVATVKEGFTDKLNVIKDHIGQAETMLKGGLESEAGVVGSHIAGKVAIGAYRYVKGTHDIHGNMTEEYKQSLKDAASKKGEAPTDTENDPTAPSEVKPNQVQPVDDPVAPTPTEVGAPSTENSTISTLRSRMQDRRFGFNRKGNPDLDGAPEPAPPPTAEEQLNTTARNQIKNYTRSGGETKSQSLETNERQDFVGDRSKVQPGTEDDVKPTYEQGKPPMKSNADGSEEVDFDQMDKDDPVKASSAEGSGDAGTGGSSNALGDLGDVGDQAAKDAAKAAAEALADTASATGDAILDAAATAFSWVPFVGEVLGAGAAIAGIATAVVGGVNTVISDNQENATQKVADAANAAAAAAKPHQVASNYAGGYVAPTSSSIQQ